MNRSHQAEVVDLATERTTSSAKSFATNFLEQSHIDHGIHVDSHVPGMETVIVTVSGYDSLTRTKLVKLIVHIGALNTGSLSNSNTHVVCWKFEGRKYELAKKLRKKIVSHRWFEDCLKAGVLLPEEPYINKSGEDEAPLSWDDSVVDLLKSKALRKADSTINLTDSVSQLESSSGGDSTTSKREHGSPCNGRSSDVDHHPYASRSRPTSSKRSVSSKTSLPRAGNDQGVFSDAPHMSLQQRPDGCPQKARNLPDDGSPKIAEPHSYHEPVELRMGKAVAASHPPIGLSFRDPSDGMRDQSGIDYAARPYSAEAGQQVRECCYSRMENYGSGGHEDYKADYSQIRLRRRKEVEVPSGGLCEKYRKLMKESPALTSSMLAYRNERTGNPSRVKYLGSPSSQHSTLETISAGAELDNLRDNYVLADTDIAGLSAEEAVVSTSPSKDIVCVICHTETKPTTEGLLECGHRYCYPCIQKWADEATSNKSTCPLCKASFEFITIRELQRSASEEIFTQVLEERVVLVGKKIRQGQKINLCPSSEAICITCESKDSPELLVTCSRCYQRSCHTFCFDPPLPPRSSWFCSRCSPMRSRYLSRETVMSRFST